MLKTINLNRISDSASNHYSQNYQGKGLFIKTFGCQMNEYDSQKMGEILQQSHGLVRVEHLEDAKIVLMNTCSVREKAQQKVFSQLGKWRQWKVQQANRLIGVGGCVASQEGSLIRQRAPFVDLIFGPQTVHRLPILVENVIQSQLRSKRQSQIDISFPEVEKFDCLPKPTSTGVSAFVSIMEGCSKYCSFCVVPYTRGEEFSRPLQLVLNEIRCLADQGVREVTLLGQNVNAYLDYYVDGSRCDFAALIAEVADIEGIERIRYTTSHPLEVTPELIQNHAKIPALAKHIHLPVQSGSDGILRAMKRGYTSQHYIDIIHHLRDTCPDIQLSSDFIVGFPGETEADFEATLTLIKQLRFDKSFSFIYSPRPGTPAASLPDSVSMSDKKKRLYSLQKLLSKQMAESMQAQIGQVQRVLVENLSKHNPHEITGRNSHNTAVVFAGCIEQIGEFVDVKIQQAFSNSLKGQII